MHASHFPAAAAPVAAVILAVVTSLSSPRVACAQPATKPVATRPTAASRPAAASVAKLPPDEAHRMAVDLMRQGQFDKASPPMERAWEAAPAEQRARALVVNRAILDVVQKVNAMRAAKELRAYLAARGALPPDELAINVFGTALAIAAKNERVAEGELYLAAARDYERANAALEATRPGQRRWGAEWVAEDIYIRRDRERRTAELTYQQESDLLLERGADLEAAKQQVKTVQARLNGYRHQHRDSKDGPESFCYDCGEIRAIRRDLDAAKAESKDADRRLDAQKVTAGAKKAIPVIEWPTRFDPVDPSEPDTAAGG